jgi:hypothetical protein
MLPRILFFLLIALLVIAELWFSNLSALNRNLEGMAALLGLTVAAARIRFLLLSVFDSIAVAGALLALVGCLTVRSRRRRIGAMMAAIGLVCHGLYQVAAALWQLPPALQPTMALLGLIYVGLGVMVWLVGMRPTPDVHPSV